MKKHTIQELQQLQAMPLEIKIPMTMNRIRAWAGCNSPFGYLQIADVQEKLCEIADILGIKGEEE